VLLGILTSPVVNRCTLATVICLLLVPPIDFSVPTELPLWGQQASRWRCVLCPGKPNGHAPSSEDL